MHGVGIYGLLASQSCYHSMLVPCWFRLWTSGRFQHPYILLKSIEIFIFSCLYPFSFSVKYISISCMYWVVVVSINSLVFLLLMAFFLLYISARLRLHACMQCIRAPPILACRPIRWLELSGKRRMVILHELTILRRLQHTSVLRDPYGAAIPS